MNESGRVIQLKKKEVELARKVSKSPKKASDDDPTDQSQIKYP